MVYRGAVFVAPATRVRPASDRAVTHGKAHLRKALTECEQSRVQRLCRQNRFHVELGRGVAAASKVLEQGIPQRLGSRRDIVGRRLRVELVQAQLDDAIDELGMQDGGMESDGSGRNGRVAPLDDGLDLVFAKGNGQHDFSSTDSDEDSWQEAPTAYGEPRALHGMARFRSPEPMQSTWTTLWLEAGRTAQGQRGLCEERDDRSEVE